jgi:heat shock protein HspQ
LAKTGSTSKITPRKSSYVAYVSQQNLEHDDSDEPVDHPAIAGLFDRFDDGRYGLKRLHRH